MKATNWTDSLNKTIFYKGTGKIEEVGRDVSISNLNKYLICHDSDMHHA